MLRASVPNERVPSYKWFRPIAGITSFLQCRYPLVAIIVIITWSLGKDRCPVFFESRSSITELTVERQINFANIERRPVRFLPAGRLLVIR